MSILPKENISNQFSEEKYLNIFVLSPNSEVVYDGIVYHYTSSAVLPNILKDKICIRFTDYRFLNDMSEGSDIPALFKDICNDLYETKIISEELFNEIKKQNDIFDNSENSLYVACFSMNGDSLPMWNYYLKDNKYNGYSIGFDFKKMQYADGLDCIKVLYSFKEVKSIISSGIRSIIHENSLFEQNDLENKSKYLIRLLKKSLLIYKKECFSHEKEVRLILDLDFVTDNEHDFICDKQIKHFEKNGILIPYCDVIWNNKDIFKEICYAPTMNPEQTELGIRSLLKSFGYDKNEYKLFKSKIPVRY